MTPDEVTGTTESESTEAVPEVVKDDAGRTIINDKFSFKVPEGHPEQGEKKNGTYTYPSCATDQQAAATHIQ